VSESDDMNFTASDRFHEEKSIPIRSVITPEGVAGVPARYVYADGKTIGTALVVVTI